MTTGKKILIGVGVIVVVAILGVFAWRANREEPFVPRDFDEVVAELKDPEKIERYTKQLVEAYKNDAYGGDTPEETLNLFIAALKAGDIDLAAKYFLLEEQEKHFSEFKKGLNTGGVNLLLQVLERGRKGYFLNNDQTKYEFATLDTSNTVEFTFTLVQNPYTKKWKIESL